MESVTIPVHDRTWWSPGCLDARVALPSRRIRSLAEYGGADAHHSSAFFDGCFEIVAHPHREFSQQGTRDPFRNPPVAQFPQLHEPRSGLLLILVPWGDQHQS